MTRHINKENWRDYICASPGCYNAPMYGGGYIYCAACMYGPIYLANSDAIKLKKADERRKEPKDTHATQ